MVRCVKMLLAPAIMLVLGACSVPGIVAGEQYCSASGKPFTLIGTNDNFMSSSVTFTCANDVNAALKAADASDQECRAQMGDHDLDPIRDKLELSKVVENADRPSVAISPNNSLPTQQERSAIETWATIRDNCIQRYIQSQKSIPLQPPENPRVEDEWLTFVRQSADRIDILVEALYQGKMTFAEFAKERAQIGEETAAARKNWFEAVNAAYQQHVAQQPQLELQQQQLADQRYQAWLQASVLQNQRMQAQLQSLKPTMTYCSWLSSGWNCTY